MAIYGHLLGIPWLLLKLEKCRRFKSELLDRSIYEDLPMLYHKQSASGYGNLAFLSYCTVLTSDVHLPIWGPFCLVQSVLDIPFCSTITLYDTTCFLTRNWLDQMTTTNRIISSQALIIIRSKRNTFIIRNQNKRKSSLYLVTKLKNFNVNLLLWRVVTTVSLYRLADSPGKRI